MPDEKKKGLALMIAMGKPKEESSPEEPTEEVVEEELETPENEALESESYELPIPEGYEPPAGAEEGKAFDEIFKVRIKDGKLCILKTGSVPTGKEDDYEDVDGTPNVDTEVPMETMKVEPNAEKAFGMAMKTQRGIS